MSGVDWGPILHILLLGAALAALPLAWVGIQHAKAPMGRRWEALTWVTLFLTFDLVIFGAFTRLTDSGLGCPDWPGCYGAASPFGAHADIHAAQQAMPTGPVTFSKAWIEMVHRYLATGVGGLIVVLLVGAIWSRRHSRDTDASLAPPGGHQRVPLFWPVLTCVWVCAQGAFGALTVTMKLFPAIVTLHLLGGLGLLALLRVQTVIVATKDPVPMLSRGTSTALWLAYGLLWLQVALGGWVSTNYAVLACTDFPTCQGQWWPTMDWAAGFGIWRELGHTTSGAVLPFAALTAIHYAHRLAAVGVLLVLVWLGWRLHQQAASAKDGRWLLGLCALQLGTGLSNVVLGWPLLAAVVHTGGAAALVVVLTGALARQNLSQAWPAAAHAVPSALFPSRLT